MVALLLCLALSVSLALAQETASLRGTVTDPFGAVVPGALVQLRGSGHQQRARTGDTGQYWFRTLAPGRYHVRISARGFATVEKKDLLIEQPRFFDTQLVIQTEKQVIQVEDGLRHVSAEPQSNGGAVLLGQKQIGILSDDPDELAMQLQALAGPTPGPNGGEVFIDGFTAGSLPPKSSIREVHINQNPFSPEYDRPGFGRIEIFTRAGSDFFHGQAQAQYNGDWLNSRNPLLTQSTRPPYQNLSYGLDVAGPVRRNKASFTLAAERRAIHDNGLILATELGSDLNPAPLNQAVPAPQWRTSVSPRLDYALNARNTLVVRYQDLRNGLDNLGVGDFNLASRAYNERQTEQTAQVTETAMMSRRAINETQFQFARSGVRDTAHNAAPGLDVRGAFFGGGASIGESGTSTSRWELTNLSRFTRNRHALQWGGRVRQSSLDDTSRSNFAGTFTFFTLAQYQKTLELQQAGYSAAQIAQMGAGPSQFSMNAGTPATRVNQLDLGLFVNDDWRVRPNLTISFGMRYEAQTNFGGGRDWAPRVGMSWGLGAKGKTVLRSGFGTFYDRIPISVKLNQLRYNGATQQSFLVLAPTFFPLIPSAGQLARDQQQLRPVAPGLQAPRLYQTSLGIERQLNASSRLAMTWTTSRGVHLLDARNINAPLDSRYPFDDRSVRLLTESAGFSRLNQVIVNGNVSYRKLYVFGFYSLSYGMDDNEGVPADPYNLRAEWGPSIYGDVRHRVVVGTTIPLPGRVAVSPFFAANSGTPFNITTGLDPGNTGFPAARPALLAGVGAPACQGQTRMYATRFGCFDLQPGPGVATIGHNSGRGPGAVNLALRIARTWGFGPETQTGSANHGDPQHGSGPPASMFGAASSRKYTVTLSAFTLNAINHTNLAAPDGDLSSPYFGQSRSLGGFIVMAHGGTPSTYNRKIDFELRVMF
jgi:hypothetical protein